MASWVESLKSEGGEKAEKIPSGQHAVEITDIVFGSKKGGAFASKAGDPQIMLIFSDSQGREAAQMVTLSEKAKFVLAKILEAGGADLRKMDEKGITPQKFAEERFATINLKGKKFTADVQWETAENGKEYSTVTPLRKPPESKPEEDSDDIPI